MTGLIDDKIPRSVRQWTIQTIEYLVDSYPRELNWIDYKEVLNANRTSAPDDHRDSIRRTVTGMANSCEGYVLFGIKDKGEPRSRIVGIDPKADLTRDFGHIMAAVTPGLPYIEEFQIRLATPYPAKKVIWAIRVPISVERPHMHKGIYPIRAVGGTCEYLTDQAVRNQMAIREDRKQKPRYLVQVLKSILPMCNLIKVYLPYTPIRVPISLMENAVHAASPFFADSLLHAVLSLIIAGDGINRQADKMQAAFPAGQQNKIGDSYQSMLGEGKSTIENFQTELENLTRTIESEFPPAEATTR